MKLPLRLVLWIVLFTLLTGLLLGVAVGRSLEPFSIGPVLAFDPGLNTEHSPMLITPQALAGSLRSNSQMMLIDVREQTDFAASHIPESESIPLDALEARSSQLPRGHLIVLYCANGLISETGSRVLNRLGYSNVWYLEGGISAWEKAGYPVVK